MARTSKQATDRQPPVIVWLRDNLRLADNRTLSAAVETGQPVLAIYIYDDASPGLRPLGGASRWWLHHSLVALGRDLDEAGAALTILRGAAGTIVPELAQQIGATAVFWSRRYGGAERALDTQIKTSLGELGIGAQSCNDFLLVEPWEITTRSGDAFKVFTPFWRALRERGDPAPPLPRPRKLAGARVESTASLGVATLEKLDLLPTRPDWAGGLRETWMPGEEGARARLTQLIRSGLDGYADKRDRPDLVGTSRLSPHLHFGEIGIREVWHRVARAAADGKVAQADAQKFLSELAWREFSNHLLFHNPDLATRNFQPRFDAFPWVSDRRRVRAWQRGQTGYPIVDAGMRELWHTGWMHNRVRMIAASFLIKHLLTDWRTGEAWFWDTLVDADAANNAASWQWVAGSGADAAPYFRIFNPVLQGRKFDPDGDYVRRWVPEIAGLPAAYIHAPWDAPQSVLATAKLELGRDYPEPIVELDEGRARALAAFETIKGAVK
jgi:deoxyribodipyrimidine photo-lyase